MLISQSNNNNTESSDCMIVFSDFDIISLKFECKK